MRFALEILQKCWFLTGPTACGKSEAGLQLAKKLDAEIISLDSMSLYRGMDIGTAKPLPEARRSIPHHLIDVLDPHEENSLAEYLEAAQAACRGILLRGRIPLFIGGTGLYLRGILRGVFDGPPADWSYRRSLHAEAEHHQPGYLHRRLQEVDARAAAALHPNDTRRLIRALEVRQFTNQPLSEQQQQGLLPIEQRPQHVYWLLPPRDWLYERINRRVEEMFAAGLVEEVNKLLSADKPLSRTARQALGYKEVIEHVNGRRSLEETVELVQTRTRQFAKRQHTWFRNLEECVPLEMTGDENPQELADRILATANMTGSA